MRLIWISTHPFSHANCLIKTICSQRPCTGNTLWSILSFSNNCLLFCFLLSNMETISQSEWELYPGPTHRHRSRRALPCLGAARLGKTFNLVTWSARLILLVFSKLIIKMTWSLFFALFFWTVTWDRPTRSPRTSSCLVAACVELDMRKEKRKSVKPGKIYLLVQEQLWHPSEHCCLKHFHD